MLFFKHIKFNIENSIEMAKSNYKNVRIMLKSSHDTFLLFLSSTLLAPIYSNNNKNADIT